ncbi:DALR anticodon-binding domain-containing protein [Thermomonospora amylolytica]|uniref:DALR anticodon-binding domain-containing protein n=1 Tax=Thermomonospora amylolytica TaxID=1411117 RepID=UPI000E6C606E|nr:DALR anticodon-binding domain-containing protein [Thermomonospora amylolytica]
MTPTEVSGAVAAAVRDAVRDGDLAAGVPDEVPLTAFGPGSYGTPVALRLAAAQRRPALEVANAIAGRLAGRPRIAEARVSGPGFLTVVVERPGTLAAGILAEGPAYGRVDGVMLGGGWPDRPRTFDNPGFSVRYAYARAAAVQRRAEALGIPLGDPGLLQQADEGVLLAALAELPSRAAQAARERDPVPLRRHLERVADAFHQVYEHCPALPVGDEKPGAMHAARRTLAEAVRIALAGGLNMIGESPRERI